ncbi:Pathogen-related protein [Gracilariopsis chorda]|uniref:Pathogen-related protein n=1 Tax=Gracilariopsis chorda TaxID=448386 RepID=A0A2V3IT08_9FLOR|nr:Pathogen-related protein [Gracilariopsis chorda]|eukprot:PXF44867.1 Pathogen-related protein [Gracilariopsis chorda]
MPTEEKHILALSEDEIRTELVYLQEEHNLLRPERSTIDPSRPWKNGLPNYDKADLLYFRGKTRNHTPESLEHIVENAVKTWEMEATHLGFQDWQSVNHDTYQVCANGAKTFKGEEAALAGNYNWLMAGVDKRLYDSNTETFESSHQLFRNTFPGGFPWEVLQVFSPPPRVSFSWRHWATFEEGGQFRGRKGDGKLYEMFGFGIVDLNADMKIESIEIFYKPEEFMKALHGEIPPSELAKGQSILGNGCPFLQGQPPKDQITQ